jgi:hypothetical protein
MAADPAEFFEKKIRPILVEHCLKCHGGDTTKEPKGGLRVDSRDALLKGGDSGPSIVPGDLAKSRLLDAVKYGNVDLQMPPKGKLPDAVIRDLETWIKADAVWPGDVKKSEEKVAFDLAKRKAEHWSWRPLSDPPPPVVFPSKWDANPIDRFIIAKLYDAKLKPTSLADATTLLRRLSSDLTGLPPSVEDVNAILSGKKTYEAFVEQYLASPHFGERWARHWMDVVRYADTRGHEFDHPIPYAWRYRDYLIRAFNADLPYRDFVTEHIAGDRLAKPRLHPTDGSNESIQGTGFWLLGEEIHSPVDIRQDQADRFDNRIDVFGKAFLGLTIACARCHDHKFDAISTKDYYSLFALLEASTPRLAQIDHVLKPNELRDGWQSDGKAYQQDDNFVSYNKHFHNLHLSQSELEPGELGKFKRAGRILRSKPFVIESGKFYVLISGGAVSYSPVGHHTLISGPLHGGIVRTMDAKPEWRWELHDLSAYKGLVTNFEFSPLPKSTFAIAGIVQAETMPPLPDESANWKKFDGSQIYPDTPWSSRLALALWEGPAVNERVFVRGSPKNLGEEVPPRFLEALAGTARLEGGRLALAKQMIDPKITPQVYRVFANRVWHHLFGRGIVASVDNFGVLGEPPSHPELLDHLAGVVRDQSPKELIRRIVLSNSYRMSSREEPIAEAADPGNRLFHRQNLRRLDSESIRDAMLTVSGRLDPKPFGPSVPVYVSQFQDGRGKPKSGPLDGDGRRSIYIRVQRNFLSPFQLAFDAPIPFSSVGKRQVSNVPAQALILLNDEFVQQQAKLWSEKAATVSGNVEDRIATMYLQAFGRPATKSEIETCRAYVNETGGFKALAHALFNVKEFTYLP